MRKQYFWAMYKSGFKTLIRRFRTKSEREQWWQEIKDLPYPTIVPEFIPGDHPEVRRIKNRLIQGEKLTWPVEIEN